MGWKVRDEQEMCPQYRHLTGLATVGGAALATGVVRRATSENMGEGTVGKQVRI